MNQRLSLSPTGARLPQSPSLLAMPLLCGFAATFCATTFVAPAQAQDDATEETTTETTAAPAASTQPAGGALTEVPPVNIARVRQAAGLVERAITIAENNPAARRALTRGAAAILPRLDPVSRDPLTMRWIRVIEANSSRSVVPRSVRLDAYSSFFDVASRVDTAYARKIAFSVPDAAARAGGLIDISEAMERRDYPGAVQTLRLAQQAARAERGTVERARALAFVADRMANLDAEGSDAAIIAASSQARTIANPATRDYILLDVVGAAARNDFKMARRITDGISDPGLKNIATARVNIAEVSQSTFTGPEAARVAAVAKAAARHETRAIPILMQLPATPDVLKALSDALPPIYPTARPAVDPSLLERMWRYTLRASEASAPRDELQSRLARLMVLHDLWRGRDWGRQLAWRGGRVQVGAFLNDVLATRRSQVRAAPLQDLARRNVNQAITEASLLPPAGRVEALLLIAGQLMG